MRVHARLPESSLGYLFNRGTVLYDFTPEQNSDANQLAVRKGQMLLLLDNSNEGDFVARVDSDLTITEQEILLVYCTEGDLALVMSPRRWAAGYVPISRIQVEQGLNQATALHDYTASNTGELSFQQKETLTVLNHESVEWWCCMNESYIIGRVPSDCVEICWYLRTNYEPAVAEKLIRATAEDLRPPAAEDDGASPQATLISTHMDTREVMARLIAQGCQNLTPNINLSTFDEHPVSYGEFGDIYRGYLTDKTLVAVKIPRIPINNVAWITKNLKDAARELYTWMRPNMRGPVISAPDRHYPWGPKSVVSHDGVPLLFDFGNSWLTNRTMSFTRTARSLSMSLRWAAPELIEENNPHSQESDVYALGMEVMTGKLPYYGKSDVLVILLVVQKREPPKRPESIPNGYETTDKLWELLLRCWYFTPTERPHAAEVAENVKKLRDDSVLSRKMVAQEVVSHLVAHGCRDLSAELELSSFGEYPVSHGGFSDIYRGQFFNGAKVAVKVLRVSVDGVNRAPKHFKHAARELHTWSRCNHPNIMPLLGLAVFRDRIGMVAYWMENGNLPEYLKRVSGVNRLDMCAQICEGLSYLHHIGIIHCDLKGANVLVSDEGVPVLSDFGTSLASDRTLRFTPTTDGPSSTLRWSAAEILKETNLHTEASDVYALGMVGLNILT
ncbi:Protein tyrosine kinase, partial [Rhizoctonia solani]